MNIDYESEKYSQSRISVFIDITKTTDNNIVARVREEIKRAYEVGRKMIPFEMVCTSCGEKDGKHYQHCEHVTE